MDRKKISFLLVFFAFFFMVPNAKSQIYTGGTAGISYDNGYVAELAPLIGYKIKIFEAGVSPFFSYFEKENKYAFGGRIFSQLTIFKETFIHAELEVANTEVLEINGNKTRKWILAMPVGGGYRYEISKGVFAYGMILYNVFQTENTQAKNPIIRGGITYQL